jgi:dolichyl-diphosphooligosaccharide---protein glycosyltransferase
MALRDALTLVGRTAMALLFAYTLYIASGLAYGIRMYAIDTYGRVIHEFDPWFNYRATEVLGQKVTSAGWYQGLTDFFHWCEQLCAARCER